MYIIIMDEMTIAKISGTEYAWEAYEKVKDLAEFLGTWCQLIAEEKWEIIASDDFEK